jgi:hypothetical protein
MVEVTLGVLLILIVGVLVTLIVGVVVGVFDGGGVGQHSTIFLQVPEHDAYE